MKRIIGWSISVLLLSSFVVSCSGGSTASAPAKPTPKANEFGVITAYEWKDTYPDHYESYKKNLENSTTYSYLEEHPQMLTLFAGFGYAKTFTAARGHTYTLHDVARTGRPHPRANCLSCKSADYTALVNMSSDNYRKPFDEIHAQVNEKVSCYNCHENDPSTVTPTHQYLINAVGKEDVNPSVLVCAQCHVDYYFAPNTFETTLPYNSVAETHPDAMIAYYDNIGFADWTNPNTGTKHVFIQHTEFETNMQAGSHIKAGLVDSCATCHMGETTNAKGAKFTSHKWTSPLENDEIFQNTCSKCHTNKDAFVTGVKAKQDEVVKYTFEVADKIVDLSNRLERAVKNGSRSEAQLNELRDLNRHAQFYWNYVVTENSNGAHNFTITKYCLDKATEIVDEALTKI